MSKAKQFAITPKDLYQKLEFDKILELLSTYCYGELAKSQSLKIAPATDILEIGLSLKEAGEAAFALEESEAYPMSTYSDLKDELKFLSVDGAVLSEEGLMKVNQLLRIVDRLFKYFTPPRKKRYSNIFSLVASIPYDPELGQAIDKVLDEEGVIRDDASELFQKLRRQRQSLTIELDRVFRKLIGEYRKKGYLADSVESIRNGRRVFTIASEHKRKIRGIIHDESATGKTAFIEPEPVLNINNKIFDVETEERKEIYRLLKELSALLRPYIPVMQQSQTVVIKLDLIQAKAAMGYAYNGVVPELKPQPHISWKEAYHPLLFIKNKKENKKTVPFTLELYGSNRVLLLSGPNAGGKSITMKSLGLLQLMVQSGMLVPVDAKSVVGVFKNICADIGDQQSIEDDLSTYSSRLKNMKEFLEKSDLETLVLIDEFGSGTDPKIGGAIAEGILRALHHQKVFGLITTHYPNLKIFAFKTKGIVNGSMTFDKDNLSPTYRLKVGTPGSSYAFEIAQSSGLDPSILKYARQRVGKNEKAVDQLLVDLQKESQELKEQLAKVQGQESKLEKLIKNYEQLFKELEFRRKRIKLDAKEQSLLQAGRDNKEFEKVIREIKESQNLERAKEMAAQVRTEKEVLNEDVDNLREAIYYEPTEKLSDKPLEAGDYVKMRTGGSIGKLERIKGKKAIVVMGLMKMTVNLRDLIPSNDPLELNAKLGVRTDTQGNNANFESKIDLRGMRKDEALRLLESFLDKALMTSASQLRIVHGKGDGVLRKAVQKKLREYKDLGSYYHPERTEGGDGVTIVDMSA